MANRTDIAPRYFTAQPPLSTELSLLTESVQQVVDELPRTETRSFRFKASGVAGTPMPPVGVSAEPVGVVFVRVMPTLDRAGATGPLGYDGNHEYVAQRRSVTLFEPDGLAADTEYEVTVLVYLREG